MSHDPNPPLPTFDPAVIFDLDVRAEIAAGGEPLPRILAVLDRLGPEIVLHLRSPFQPVPLRSRLAERGLLSHSVAFSEDDWSTWFWRADLAPTLPRPLVAPATVAELGIMDLRILPPPEPLIRILERIDENDDPFDVLLPFFPEPLVAILEPTRRRIVLIENRSDGVQVRVEAPGV